MEQCHKLNGLLYLSSALINNMTIYNWIEIFVGSVIAINIALYFIPEYNK